MRENTGQLAAIDDEVGISAVGQAKVSVQLAWTPVTGDTVQFEAMPHPEGAWGSIEGYPMDDMNSTGVTSSTTAGAWVFDISGIARFRVRASAIGATPIDVKIYAE